jgi:hypothetical protein
MEQRSSSAILTVVMTVMLGIVPAGPAHALGYRCLDNEGHVHFGLGDPPPWCLKDNAEPRRRDDSEERRLRASEEFRQQLHVLLETARGASGVLASGSYDAFALRMRAVAQQVRSMNVKFAVPIKNGDHQALRMAVGEALWALYTADVNWQKELKAGRDAASAEEAVKRQRRIGTPTYALTEVTSIAQQQYEEAKERLATSRESVTRIMTQAMRAARDDEEQRLSAGGLPE